VEIVSVDEIVFDGVELVAGGRSLTGDIELVPHGTNALTVRKVALSAGGTNLELDGEITDVAAATGALTLKAGSIDAVALMAFLDEFTAAAVPVAGGPAASAPAPASAATPMHITVSMSADTLTFGTLLLEHLGGVAEVTGEQVTINEAKFNVFGGSANGVITLALDAASSFSVNAAMSGVNMATVMGYLDSPGTMTGTAAGTLALRGHGVTADEVINSVTGTMRLDTTDGTVRGLGLVRAIVLAGSMRASSQAQVKDTAADEPFTRLGMTLTIADGKAHTDDLTFESPDVLLDASGDVALDASRVAFSGAVQLSDALTRSAGRDLVRYTQKDGKVTLPVNVTGSPAALKVRVDLADMAKRALTNKAKEEAKKGLLKGLGKIIKK
jgi:AsmA protein